MISVCIFVIIQLNLVFTTPPNMYPMVQTITENEGNPTRIMCGAYGDQPITFEWKKDGQKVFDTTYIKVTTSKDISFLSFERLQLIDAGNYTCIVKNTHGHQ
ncbi:Down syndrome cell adhesion molecule-like protein, partial [Leptotrombidium deliense]